jgi:uncharacterized protein (TIGR03503 family)
MLAKRAAQRPLWGCDGLLLGVLSHWFLTAFFRRYGMAVFRFRAGVPGLSSISLLQAVLPCLLGLLLGVCAAVAQAQTPSAAPAVDVRLVIDVSGSMKQNDPDNLRRPAVELLCRLMPGGSRAGIWFFAQGVNAPVPLAEVNDAWKAKAIGVSKTVHSQGLFTHIGKALEAAAEQPGLPDQAKHIILLTDGMVDIAKDPAANQAEWARINQQLLPELKKAGFKIHTIALSKNADTNLLNKLAASTDAAAVVALTADQLTQAFLQVFDTAAPAQQLPIENNSFVVDESIDELTVLIFRSEVAAQLRLRTPGGEEFGADAAPKNVNWFRGDNYDLITIKKPPQGSWTILGQVAPGSRVTLVSDLRLQVSPLASNLFVGHQGELKFEMQESGQTFINPEFLKLMKIAGQLSSQEGAAEPKDVWGRDLSEAVPPADGLFRADLPALAKAGVYTLSVRVEGKTFKREYRQRLAVRDRFEASLEPVGDHAYELSVKTYDDSIDKSSLVFMAHLENAERQKTPLTLVGTPVETWLAPIEVPKPGRYQVKISVRAKTQTGETQLHELNPLVIEHNLTAVPAAPAAAPEDASKTPEPAPEPAPKEPEAEPASTTSLPSWALYSGLGFLNILVLGLGYFAYKKLFSGKSAEAMLAEFSDEKIAAASPPAAKAKPAFEPPPLEEEYDETQMQVPATEDEVPPMEDLDPDMGLDDMAMLDVAAQDEEETTDQALSEDDIDALFEQKSEQAAPVEEQDDMVKAMLKAQGLDLAESELDDAISSLIDELDQGGAAKAAKNQAADDFDDFDDFGLDEKK